MTRKSFTEHRYVCLICGERFTALGGPVPVPHPVCASCGLRWPAEKVKRLISEKKGNRETK